MKKKTSGKITHTWKKIREKILPLNPELTHLIDVLDPDDDHFFYEFSFRYGDEINFEDFDYPHFSTHPVFIVFQNSVEWSADAAQAIIPLGALLKPGDVFGPQTALPLSGVKLTAGARSIYMAQKIHEKEANRALQKEFDIQIKPPKNMKEQWCFFKSIANNDCWGEPWCARVLVFSRAWFTHVNEVAWQGFYRYLLDQHSKSSIMQELDLSLIRYYSGLKPTPYVIYTARHLLGIASGIMPGFSPSIDESIAPIKRLSQAYNNFYHSSMYPATFLTPHLLSDFPVYYSFNYPTALPFSKKTHERSSLMNDMSEVRQLLEVYFRELQMNSQMKCFHSEPKDYYDIRANTLIPKEDARFPKVDDACFPVKSTFLTACVKISLIKQNEGV
ncbi:MAG: hypothetical protein ACE365_07100 [Gammaproteobacteria bacterium]